jgi:hypothetical protein
MAEQFENPETTKLEAETVSDVSKKKKIDRVAQKAATKSTKTVQHYDKNNSGLFSR